MSHVAWPEIKSFHVVRGNARYHPEILGGRTTVEYRAKVKLHGRNGAVQVRGDRVMAQSRTEFVAGDGDNAQMRSFAAWVEAQRDLWIATTNDGSTSPSMIYFGEWCGPGINKGTAVNKIPSKVFAVFAAAELKEDESSFIIDPEALGLLIEDVPGAYVLPWCGEAIRIPMLDVDEVITPILDEVNARVAAVEACDPWVKETFDVDGIGEGLVFYPRGRSRQGFTDLVFKAKGERHQVVAQRAPAQIDSAAAASAEAYADLVLTPARLEQGASFVSRSDEVFFEKRLIGPFLAWICGDVEKETAAELAASGLSWRQVQRVVSDRARAWYLRCVDRNGTVARRSR